MTSRLDETMERLLLLMRAGTPVIYVVSHEESRVLEYITRLVRVLNSINPPNRAKTLLRWYETTGLEECTIPPSPATVGSGQHTRAWLTLPGVPKPAPGDSNGTTPWRRDRERHAEGMLWDINVAAHVGDALLENSVSVMFDLHPYLYVNANISLVRPLRNMADELRRYYDRWAGAATGYYKTLFIIGPSAAGLSTELARDVIVIDFPLPEQDELALALDERLANSQLIHEVDPSKVTREVIEALAGEGTDLAQYHQRLRELIAGAGRGLTLDDFKLGLNMFAVDGRPLSKDHVEAMLDLKAKAITNQALRYTPHVQTRLGGLESVKSWVRLRSGAAASREIRERYHLPPPKGVMLLGVSGGGKSQLARLIASEFNLALLRLDVGALFGMYVGESEERTRLALQLAEMLAPVVLWLDEIEKAFQGAAGGGDNGVSARVFGHFLTWLAEQEDGVFVVATANDFEALLDRFPEFGRKGRFDEIIWVDLPGDAAREEIFEIYLRRQEQYLQVTSADVERLADRQNLAAPRRLKSSDGENQPSVRDPLSELSALLSEQRISGNLTGAEIEHAIGDALLEAYKLDASRGQRNTFIADVVLAAVLAAKERALYRAGQSDDNRRRVLAAKAAAKHWLMAT